MASVLEGHRFTDVGRRFDESFDRVNALRTSQARMGAGNALAAGNYGAAAQELYGAGDLETGARVANAGRQVESDQQKMTADQEKAVMDYTLTMAKRLMTVADDPNAAVQAFDQYFADDLIQLGETPDEIAQVRQSLMANPRQTLGLLGAEAEKRLKTYNTRGGVVAVDEGALEQDFADPDAVRVIYEPPEDPLDAELKRARIDATRAQVGQREAAAEKSRRAPAGRSSGGTAVKLPPGFILD